MVLQDGKFGPDDPVRRQQFAKMIVLTGVDSANNTVSEDDVCLFKDVEIGGYADPFFPGTTTWPSAPLHHPRRPPPPSIHGILITRYQVISSGAGDQRHAARGYSRRLRRTSRPQRAGATTPITG